MSLTSEGNRSDLQQRLLEHYKLVAYNSESDYDDAASCNVPKPAQCRSLFTLRDVEDSFTPFSGTDSININHWLDDFEENAETLGWNGIQKFIYCKRKNARIRTN